jgi:hypothetical protein
MRQLGRFFRLPTHDQRLLISAVFLLVAVQLGLKLLP